MEQHTNIISHTIKRICCHKLFSPAIYLFLLFFLWFLFPFSDLLFPYQLSKTENLKNLFRQNQIYIETTLHDLSFSGYACTFGGKKRGYYYYTTYNHEVIFVLLSPKTCKNGVSHIDKIHLSGILGHNTQNFRQMLASLSQDLNWTQEGIKSQVSSYYISEPDFHSPFTILFLVFYFLSGVYALFTVVTNILYIIFPILSPPCHRLKRYGNCAILLEQAEKELHSETVIVSGTLFLTEHFFIELSSRKVTILPIHEIYWIYKDSTIHSFFGRYCKITYILHIFANKHLHISCSPNRKSDIDCIIDGMSSINPKISIGSPIEKK